MLYTQTTYNIEEMNRTDLIFEIAKHSHIDHYHRIIAWKDTEKIRALLRFYKDAPRIFMGIDWAKPGGDESVFSIEIVNEPIITVTLIDKGNITYPHWKSQYKKGIAGEALRPGPVKEYHVKMYRADTKLDPIRKLKIK